MLRQIVISQALAEDILKWLDVLADTNPDPEIMAVTCALVYRMNHCVESKPVPERSGNTERGVNQMGEAW